MTHAEPSTPRQVCELAGHRSRADVGDPRVTTIARCPTWEANMFFDLFERKTKKMYENVISYETSKTQVIVIEQ